MAVVEAAGSMLPVVEATWGAVPTAVATGGMVATSVVVAGRMVVFDSDPATEDAVVGAGPAAEFVELAAGAVAGGPVMCTATGGVVVPAEVATGETVAAVGAVAFESNPSAGAAAAATAGAAAAVTMAAGGVAGAAVALAVVVGTNAACAVATALPVMASEAGGEESPAVEESPAPAPAFASTVARLWGWTEGLSTGMSPDPASAGAATGGVLV